MRPASLAALVVAFTSSAWGSAPVSRSNPHVTTTPTVTMVPGHTNAQLKKQLDGMSTRLDDLLDIGSCARITAVTTPAH